MLGERRGYAVVTSSSQKEVIRLTEQTRTSTERRHVELPMAFAVNGAGLPEAALNEVSDGTSKAKQEARFRFYTRYDRGLRPDVRAAAWDQVAANDSAPGMDGVRIEDIENAPGGVERFLEQLHDTLKRKRYRPQAVRLKMIPISDWTWCNSKAGLPYDSLRCKGNRKAQCGKTACCV